MARWIVRALFAAATLCFTAHTEAQEIVVLSLQQLEIKEGERIIDFEVRLRGAFFVRVRELPPDWALSIDNHAAQTRMSGGTHHGAGALYADFFDRLFFLQKWGQEISVSGEVTVTRDFDTTRTILLGPDQIRIQNP